MKLRKKIKNTIGILVARYIIQTAQCQKTGIQLVAT